jgi:hypothetical protein
MKTKWIWLAALIAGGTIFTTSNAAVAAGNRFLFIVETSSSTSNLEHGGRQAAFDLIYTGVYDQMRAGDTFGLWTYNQMVSAGVYPIQKWTPEKTLELASNAGQFLKNQPYEKEGQLANALKQVMSLVRSVKDVNIFIISDPSSRPDDVIGPGYTTVYKQKAEEARAKKKPLVTTIIAKSGSISNWFVNVAGESIHLPKFAIPEHVMPTNNPAPLAKAAPKPRPVRAPIIMKGTPPSAELSSGPTQTTAQTNQSLSRPSTTSERGHTGTPANASASTALNPEQHPNKEVGSSTPGAQAAKVSAREQIPTMPYTEPSRQGEAKSGSATATPPSAAVQRSPVKAEPAGPSIETSTELNAFVTSPPERSFSPRLMIIIGGSLLVLAAILTLVFVNHLRRPARASFISRSMER